MDVNLREKSTNMRTNAKKRCRKGDESKQRKEEEENADKARKKHVAQPH